MLVCHFLWNCSFKTSSQVFHNNCVPKKLDKTHGKLYMPASLFQKSWRLQVEKRFWCRCIPVNFVKFLRMTIYWYMCKLLFLISWDIPIYGYPVQGPHWRNAIFSSILIFIHFKLILKSCTTSGVYLEPYQTSMMKPLAVVRGYFRNWGQHPDDRKKGTFSLQKSKKGHP